MNTKKRLIIINIFWFVVVAFLSYRMPLITDDYLHMNSFATGERITSPGMLLPSVMTYYNTWGGRALSMIMIQSMLQFPRLVYSIVNALIYVAVVNLICLYGRRSSGSGSDDVLTAAVYIILWFFMPAVAEDVYWITGSITYLWMNLVILMFGLIYYGDYLKVRAQASSGTGAGSEDVSETASAKLSGPKLILRIIGMLVFGFCAGLSNEAGACTLICALFAYTVYMLKTRNKLLPDRVAGMIGTIAGTAFLLLAPGNFVRADTVAQPDSMIMRFGFRIARESYYFLQWLTIPILLCVVLMILVHRRNGAEIFLALALISVYVMTGSVVFSNRILQMTLFLVTIGIAVSLSGLRNSMDNRASVALRVLLTGLLLVVIVEIATGVLITSRNQTFFDRHMDYSYSFEVNDGGLIPDE
ncbi:hypothetical protein SAMN02910292_00812 [Lachnospiraceae bacterium XBB2008]|nr:hypothetical protein SAMN02910292_00812 [Lachnospiraceae bacterium XBB2008]